MIIERENRRRILIEIIPLLVFIGIIYLLSLIALSQLDFPYYGIDDANIFFKYAKNIVNGDGIRWQVNGEVVEGFTSPLWLVICIIFEFFFKNKVISLLIFNSFIFLLILFLLYRELIHFNVNFFTSILICILFASYPGVYNWLCFSLMETGLWCLSLIIFVKIMSCFVNNEKSCDKKLLLLIFTLLLFIRPESNLILLVTFLSLMLLKKISIKSFLIFTIFVLFVLTIMTTFRLYYFGHPLPNTFYAKVNFDFYNNILQGIMYVKSFFINHLLILVLFLISFVGIITKKERDGSAIRLVSFIVILSAFLSEIITGGDHFILYRKLTPFYPFILVIFFSFSSIFSNLLNYKSKIYSILILAILYFSTFELSQFIAKHEYTIASVGRLKANLINNAFTKAIPSVGTMAVGGLGYAYKGDVIDLMGLNNTSMAHASSTRKGIKNHAAFDKSMFYNLSPDLIINILAPCINSTTLYTEYFNKALKNILFDAKFKKIYKPYFIDSNPKLCGYIKKNFVSQNFK